MKQFLCKKKAAFMVKAAFIIMFFGTNSAGSR